MPAGELTQTNRIMGHDLAILWNGSIDRQAMDWHPSSGGATAGGTVNHVHLALANGAWQALRFTPSQWQGYLEALGRFYADADSFGLFTAHQGAANEQGSNGHLQHNLSAACATVKLLKEASKTRPSPLVTAVLAAARTYVRKIRTVLCACAGPDGTFVAAGSRVDAGYQTQGPALAVHLFRGDSLSSQEKHILSLPPSPDAIDNLGVQFLAALLIDGERFDDLAPSAVTLREPMAVWRCAHGHVSLCPSIARTGTDPAVAFAALDYATGQADYRATVPDPVLTPGAVVSFIQFPSSNPGATMPAPPATPTAPPATEPQSPPNIVHKNGGGGCLLAAFTLGGLMLKRFMLAVLALILAAPLAASVGYQPPAGTLTYAVLGNLGNTPTIGRLHPEFPLTATNYFASVSARYGLPQIVVNTPTDFKAWAKAGGNEVRFWYRDALAWQWSTGQLPHVAGTDGQPTDQEITDAQAVGFDLNPYHRAVIDGGDPARPLPACDATKPSDWSAIDPFWHWPVYYHNTCPSSKPTPTPSPSPSATPPPSSCLSGLCTPQCPMNCTPPPAPSPSTTPEPTPAPSATPCPTPGPYPSCPPCAAATPCPAPKPCPVVTPCHVPPQWVADYAAWLVTHSGPNQLAAAKKLQAWIAAEKAYCGTGAP